MDFVSLRELEALARPRLPAPTFDYVAGGAADERTLRENEAAWGRWALRPRVLVDVSRRDPATTVLGRRVALPALVAPTAFHKLLHADGEIATARAAAAAGTLFVASTLSTVTLEEIAAASDGPKWFQLYAYKDRDLTRSLVERAVRAGYDALVLTVDVPVQGRRERDVRHGFTLPAGLHMANLAHAAARLPDLGPGESGLHHYVASLLDGSLTWDDVAWLHRISGLPIVVKGITTAGDARAAIHAGAAAVVVSNHGGRQLDPGVATADALPEIAHAANGACEVYVDGGVRRGTDVLVALALGARAVLLGRPIAWSLALGGEAGVAHALRTLHDEIDAAMALCGVRRPEDAGRGHVRRA